MENIVDRRYSYTTTPEDELQAAGVFGFDGGENVGVELGEHLLGEGADVVEVELERVDGLRVEALCELLPDEFGVERHCEGGCEDLRAVQVVGFQFQN